MNSQPDPLGRTDFVDHWAEEARHHADAIAVPAERIAHVVEVLEETFGADWLRGRSKAPSRYSLTRDPKKHPVAHLIASPHRSSVMQLIELAVYLRSCALIPGFAEVAKLLRAVDQFSTARVQLALAHRFVRCGADDVELEPVADRGRRADLAFRYAGRRHLVECYEPAPQRNANHDDLLHQGIGRILKVALAAGRRIVVRIDIAGDLSVLDVDMRKRIEREATRLIEQLGDARQRLATTDTSFELEVIDTTGVPALAVKDLAFSMGKPGAWIVAPGLTSRAKLTELARGAPAEIAHAGWFVVNTRPRDAVDAMKRITDAIERKVSQVRRQTDDARGLMVVITDFARLAARSPSDARPLIESLQRKVLATHEGVAGVLLADHMTGTSAHGPRLGGLLLLGRDGGHLEDLYATLALRESRTRVLDDWV